MLTSHLGPHEYLDTVSLQHLPLIREQCLRVGIVEVLNGLFPQEPSQHVSHALCALVLILRIFSAPGQRLALYKIAPWLDGLDLHLLLGEGDFYAEDFNDDRLAAFLDDLFEAGCDTVLSHLVARWLQRSDPKRPFSIHQDTSSLSLYGLFDRDIADEAAHPKRGFSKDHRPDLRQLIFGLAVHGDSAIPLDARFLDGNTADPDANRDAISALARRLPQPPLVTLVGDCKLVDARTIGEIQAEGFHFISLLPDSFSLRKTVIDLVAAGDPLPLLRERPGRKKSDQPRQWRGRTVRGYLAVEDPETEERTDQPMRFVVIHSSGLAERFEKSLPERLEKERQSLGKSCERYSAQRFSCRADAQAALKSSPQGKWLEVSWAVHREEVQKPYPHTGRPRKGESRPVIEEFFLAHSEFSTNEAAVAAARRSASHFVLVTDHLHEQTWSDAEIEAEYHHQHQVEGQTGFRWLKSEAGLSPVFLHKPERIMALGLVFVMALMVRNALQFELRERLAAQEECVQIHPQVTTATPTTEAILELFTTAGLVLVRHNFGLVIVERHLTGLSPEARKILALLNIDPAIWTSPPEKHRMSQGHITATGPPCARKTQNSTS